MLENNALILGILLMITSTSISIISWIMGLICRVHTQKISLMTLGEKGKVISKKIKSTEITLGWIPFGSYLSFLGMYDEFHASEEEQQEYHELEFRGKPKWVQVLITIMPPLIIGILGWLLLFYSTNQPILDIFSIYFKTSLFLLPLENANTAFAQVYSDPIFLAGCIFFFSGAANVLLNYQLPIKSETANIIVSLILQILPLLISITGIRLIWINFSYLNLVYYFMGIFSVGILSYFLFLGLIKFLPIPVPE